MRSLCHFWRSLRCSRGLTLNQNPNSSGQEQAACFTYPTPFGLQLENRCQGMAEISSRPHIGYVLMEEGALLAPCWLLPTWAPVEIPCTLSDPCSLSMQVTPGTFQAPFIRPCSDPKSPSVSCQLGGVTRCCVTTLGCWMSMSLSPRKIPTIISSLGLSAGRREQREPPSPHSSSFITSFIPLVLPVGLFPNL